jgi:hypothetical protein
MARVMIKCPVKKVPIFTGLDMNKGSFASATMTNNSVGCPACGETHVWNKGDSWLEAEK